MPLRGLILCNRLFRGTPGNRVDLGLKRLDWFFGGVPPSRSLAYYISELSGGLLGTPIVFNAAVSLVIISDATLKSTESRGCNFLHDPSLFRFPRSRKLCINSETIAQLYGILKIPPRPPRWFSGAITSLTAAVPSRTLTFPRLSPDVHSRKCTREPEFTIK